MFSPKSINYPFLAKIAALVGVVVFFGPGAAQAVPLAAETPTPGSIDHVCVSTNPLPLVGLVDITQSSNDAVPFDVPLSSTPAQVGPHLVFLGSAQPIQHLDFQLRLAGKGGDVVWSYWNGNFWAPLTVVDGTNNFHLAGFHRVNVQTPGDWAPTSPGASCPGLYYYVFIVTNHPYTVMPAADYILAS